MHSLQQPMPPRPCCSSHRVPQCNPPYEDDSASSMNIEYSNDHLMQTQTLAQMTLKEKNRIQESLYYMDGAYKRVIAAISEVEQSLHINSDIAETALLRLNFLIDNANMQFQMANKRFPSAHREVFEESLRNLGQDFKNILNSQNIQVCFEGATPEYLEHLMESFSKFQKVLGLESVPLTPVSRNETDADADPSALVEVVGTYFAKLDESEKELAEIKETSDVSPLKPETSTDKSFL